VYLGQQVNFAEVLPPKLYTLSDLFQVGWQEFDSL